MDKEEDIYIDTAAEYHVTKDAELLEDIRECRKTMVGAQGQESLKLKICIKS